MRFHLLRCRLILGYNLKLGHMSSQLAYLDHGLEASKSEREQHFKILPFSFSAPKAAIAYGISVHTRM